MKTFVDVEIMK